MDERGSEKRNKGKVKKGRNLSNKHHQTRSNIKQQTRSNINLATIIPFPWKSDHLQATLIILLFQRNDELFHQVQLSAIAAVAYKLTKGEGMNIGIKSMFGLRNVLRDQVRTSRNGSFYFYVGIELL